jgi:hypothetical protein
MCKTIERRLLEGLCKQYIGKDNKEITNRSESFVQDKGEDLCIICQNYKCSPIIQKASWVIHFNTHHFPLLTSFTKFTQFLFLVINLFILNIQCVTNIFLFFLNMYKGINYAPSINKKKLTNAKKVYQLMCNKIYLCNKFHTTNRKSAVRSERRRKWE